MYRGLFPFFVSRDPWTSSDVAYPSAEGVAAPAGLPVGLGAAEAARLARDGGSPAFDTEPEGLGLVPSVLGAAAF